MLERCSPRYAPGVGCTRKDITRERKAPRPNWISNGIPIRWEPGNRGKTPDRAVGSPGHLGHLTGPLYHGDASSTSPSTSLRQALLPSARYERGVGVSLVRAAWERRPEGPAYLLSSVTLLYLAGLCAF